MLLTQQQLKSIVARLNAARAEISTALIECKYDPETATETEQALAGICAQLSIFSKTLK